MSKRIEALQLAKDVIRFSGVLLILSVLVGSSVAMFLALLNRVTQLNWSYPWLLLALPFAGVFSWWMYQKLGPDADKGNGLVFDRIRKPEEAPKIPFAMAPLVLLGTLITHLFGGSAGREGTAVQMGAGISGWLSRWVNQQPDWQRGLLLCGVSTGFGAVFGTPIAGAIFAIEVARLGRRGLFYLLPCLFSGYFAHWVTIGWGIEHSTFDLPSLSVVSDFNEGTEAGAEAAYSLTNLQTWVKIGFAAVLFGWLSTMFIFVTGSVNRFWLRVIRKPWLRPMMGAAMLIVLTLLLGSRDYLGIGVAFNPTQNRTVCIASSFEPGGADAWSWLWKLLATALTVGSGFKGGEVTPLFFVGSCAGNVMGHWLDLPIDLMAAIGFVAVFAGATKTPLACTALALELLAPNNPELISSGFFITIAFAIGVCRFASGQSHLYHSSNSRDKTQSHTKTVA